MPRHHRRAFYITHAIAFLPLAVVVTSISYQLVRRTMRVQTTELRRIDDDAMAAHLTRRLHRDASAAHTVTLASDGPKVRLELVAADDAGQAVRSLKAITIR